MFSYSPLYPTNLPPLPEALKCCPNGCESDVVRTYSDLLNPIQYGYKCKKCGKEFYRKGKI
jgi:hypothetical protein